MGDKAQTPARILVIDDDSGNVRLLERFLKDAGYRDVQSTTDSRKAPALYQTFQPDLILLDLMMPYLDGVAVIQQLSIPEDVYLPVLVLTADVTLEAKQRALAAGAKDFLAKPFDRLEVLLRIKNLLDTRRLYLELERHNRSLEQTALERTQQFPPGGPHGTNASHARSRPGRTSPPANRADPRGGRALRAHRAQLPRDGPPAAAGAS